MTGRMIVGIVALGVLAGACAGAKADSEEPDVAYATATPGGMVAPLIVRDGPPPTATPTATATPTPELSVPVGGTLSEPAARHVLTLAGWPDELHDEALAVAWCESGWQPWARNPWNPYVLGLFQLDRRTWFSYAGYPVEEWADPVVNAAVAWATYRYDIAKGYAPWTQWECTP